MGEGPADGGKAGGTGSIMGESMQQAYCGPPPVPATLAWNWSTDWTALALCAALAALVWRRGGASWPLAGAIVWLLVLFISPLCALTTALFSARATHHVLLVAVAAPLVALALPARRPSALPLPALAAVHALVLWFWHVPAVYEAAIGPAALYWTMQLSLLGSAVLLWRAVFAAPSPGPALIALAATTIQMGMLGALLTFAGEPLYAPHLATTAAFGLTPREDQQLAGLIMWVPAALPYLAVALVLIARGLSARRPGPQAG